jgi:hypothetical protein
MLHKHAEHCVYLQITTRTPMCTCWLTVAHVIAGGAHITEHLLLFAGGRVEGSEECTCSDQGCTNSAGERTTGMTCFVSGTHVATNNWHW